MNVKPLFALFFVFAFGFSAINAQEQTMGFEFNAAEMEQVFAETNQMEAVLVKITDLNLKQPIELGPEQWKQLSAPGALNSFWWSFVLSAVGTYSIYGVVLGPISVLVVYLSSDADKAETKKALWGWLAGSAVGATAKFITLGL